MKRGLGSLGSSSVLRVKKSPYKQWDDDPQLYHQCQQLVYSWKIDTTDRSAKPACLQIDSITDVYYVHEECVEFYHFPRCKYVYFTNAGIFEFYYSHGFPTGDYRAMYLEVKQLFEDPKTFIRDQIGLCDAAPHTDACGKTITYWLEDDTNTLETLPKESQRFGKLFQNFVSRFSAINLQKRRNLLASVLFSIWDREVVSLPLDCWNVVSWYCVDSFPFEQFALVGKLLLLSKVVLSFQVVDKWHEERQTPEDIYFVETDRTSIYIRVQNLNSVENNGRDRYNLFKFAIENTLEYVQFLIYNYQGYCSVSDYKGSRNTDWVMRTP
eukprot:TRINITY_DN696_c1_g3_i1.p1 TRINITY_DN696_c1_g3~~TRINITY_DN696_c1_g3_i1.p1  ORF type:complete len:325 (-),score=36.85 TRINITY_DN696_c1_g3_i1:1018-1992(-)